MVPSKVEVGLLTSMQESGIDIADILEDMAVDMERREMAAFVHLLQILPCPCLCFWAISFPWNSAFVLAIVSGLGLHNRLGLVVPSVHIGSFPIGLQRQTGEAAVGLPGSSA